MNRFDEVRAAWQTCLSLSEVKQKKQLCQHPPDKNPIKKEL